MHRKFSNTGMMFLLQPELENYVVYILELNALVPIGGRKERRVEAEKKD